ncbi:MAG TPA: hypothetical protein VLI05_02690 [Candidatus Saccharimonadia bacterium]|nr:hypothetical protein [Candidatus Saccharimonadia bacterium]
MKRKLQRGLNWATRTVLMTASGLFTLFIFANSYELAFDRPLPLPLASAVAKVDLSPFTNLVHPADALASSAAERVGNYGQPNTLRLPTRQIKLPLAPAIVADDVWAARSNTGHFMVVGPAKGGNLGDLFVYMRQSWRTIDQPRQIVAGDNLFVDTDKGWRYMYRVSETQAIPESSRYVLADSRVSQIVLTVENASSHSVTIIKADFVSVQSIDQ